MQTKSLDGGGWIATLFDPSHPNLFIITIPSLLMMMMGVRKLGVIYFFFSCLWLMMKNAT